MWICFTGDISSILNQTRVDEMNLCTHIEDMSDIFFCFDRLEKRTMYQKPAQYMANIGYVHLMISKFILESSQGIESQSINSKMTNNHVMGMTCFIEQNFMNSITVNDVIHYIQLDRSYASSLYKRARGISIFDDIQARRLSMALDLFKTSYSIKEITYTCGFKSYQNFLSIFRKHFGVTPGEYRSTRVGN
jgi:AraC-like DNA-binding protein